MTKSHIASILGSVFGPIGVFNPILMKSKIFICLLCRAKVDWISHLMKNFVSLGYPFVVILKLILRSFLEEHLPQIVPLNCVCLLMPLRRLMDVLFYVVQDANRNLFFSKVKASPLTPKRHKRITSPVPRDAKK